MEKVVVWGAGNNWRKYKSYILKHYDVIALVDKYAYDNKEVFPIEKILELNFDKILISPSDFKEIYDQLIDMNVSKSKIIVFVLEFIDSSENSRESIGLTCYGQHFDDLIVAAIFGQIGINRPTYLDLGANLPFSISNTALLYKNGCRGVNVDANPILIERFDMIRREDVNVNVGVATEDGELDFYMFDDFSGVNTFSRAEAERCEKQGLRIRNIAKVPVITLQEIIDTYCGGIFPDFLDCDIEGLDYEVLSKYDLSMNGPKVVCVEVREKDVNLFDNMMIEQKYYKFCRIGENNIYVRNEYSNLVSHFSIT